MRWLLNISTKIGITSWKALFHLLIAEIIINLLWDWFSKMFELPVIREIGFLVLFVAVIFAVAWYLPKLSPALGGAIKQEQRSKPLTWLGQELSSDLKRVYKGMRGRVTHYDFSGIYNRESYFDVFIELANSTLFTFCLKGISGFMKIAGEPCINPPQVSTRFGIKRDEPVDIRLRQPIAPETVAIIQNAGNSNQEIEFNLGEVIFEIENTTEGYEKYKPYMTGGKYNIVPKDGLKIEDKTDIDVHKHLVREIEKQGYFPIDVEFTLKVPRLPIQLAKAQLCIADEIIEPISVRPTIPRTLEANVESYAVKYEPTYKQFLKSRIITSDRDDGERELNLRSSRSRWMREECKAHLRLTIGGKEEDFPEFTFDFESPRSQ